jgi:hypothetical protein
MVWELVNGFKWVALLLVVAVVLTGAYWTGA